MNEKIKPKPPKLANFVLISLILILFLPLSMMITSSLFIKNEWGQWHVTAQYFLEVFRDPNLTDALTNSLLVAISASMASVVFGTFAALALAKSRFFGESILKIGSILSLVFPEIVFALSLLSLFYLTHIELNLLTVITAHISFSLPYVILTIGSRAQILDQSIDDAAKDMGANDWTLIRRIHIPILMPAIISSFFLSFLLSFDDFLITFFVNGVGSDTLPIKLYTSMKTGISPKLNALATLMFLATFFFLVISNRFSRVNASLTQTEND